MESLLQDLRQALRALRKHPSFSLIVVATLALGIGVSTLVFCFADLIVLRPLPFQEIDRVASVWMAHPERGQERVPVSAGDFLDWREQATSFEALAARSYTAYNLTGVELPARLLAVRATASLFRVWGLRAVLGRTFRDDEDRPGAARVVAVSHGFWERELGSDPDAIGRRLRLDGESWEIVGVLDPAIEIGGLSQIEVWTPLLQDLDTVDREQRVLRVDGRLAAGVSLDDAAAEMEGLAARLAEQHPATNAGYSPRVMALRESVMGPGTFLIAALLSLTVALVLAIVCANVASLMLSRSAARSRETALRAALGAGRLRLLRQLLCEGLLLALPGGALGLVLAWGAVRAIQVSTYDPAFQLLGIEARALGFSLAISLLTPLLFALAPGLQALRSDLAAALREGGGRSAGSGRAGRARGALVVAQLSLALMLLVVAGLSVRTAIELQSRDLGFDPSGVAIARLDLPEADYPGAERLAAFNDALLSELAGHPLAESVALSSLLPVTDTAPASPLAVEGAPPPAPGAAPWAAAAVVSPGFFETLRIPLLAGRGFSAADAEGAQQVALVSQAFARRYLDGDALGRRIRLGAAEQNAGWRTVVGVTADLQNPNLSEPPLPQAWIPLAQQPQRSLALLIRTPVPGQAIAAARAELTRLDPEQVLWSTRSYPEQLARDRNWAAVITLMFASFGLAALLLAAIGLYGVISYAVGQRTREIGVRIALGARRGDVLAMVLRQALWLLGLGIGIGVLGGLGLGQAMRSLLVGVTPGDPVTFAAVVGLLAGVGLAAALLPALRASRVDPMRALRVE